MLAGTRVLLVVMGATQGPTVAEVQSAVGKEYQALLEAGFRVYVHVSVTVHRSDPAVDLKEHVLLDPQRRPYPTWQHEITRRDVKVKSRWTGDMSPEALEKYSWLTSFDGNHCWASDLGQHDQMVLMWPNAKKVGDRAVREGLPGIDLYADVIGLDGAVSMLERSLKGPSPFPYRVDVALATGRYEVVEPEAREGESRCVVVERKGLDRLWLDRDRGYSVVRRDWRWAEGKSLRNRVRNSYFREDLPGVWLPRSSTVEFMGKPDVAPDTLCVTARISVKDLQVRPNESFVPRAKVGMIVFDMPGKKDYRVPDGRDADLAKLADGEEGFPRVEPYNSVMGYIVTGNLVVIAIALALLLWRFWRRRAGTESAKPLA